MVILQKHYHEVQDCDEDTYYLSFLFSIVLEFIAGIIRGKEMSYANWIQRKKNICRQYNSLCKKYKRMYKFLKVFIYLAAPGLSYSMWDLVPRPGIESRPPVLGAQSLSHWNTREVLRMYAEYKMNIKISIMSRIMVELPWSD